MTEDLALESVVLLCEEGLFGQVVKLDPEHPLVRLEGRNGTCRCPKGSLIHISPDTDGANLDQFVDADGIPSLIIRKIAAFFWKDKLNRDNEVDELKKKMEGLQEQITALTA